MVTANEYCAAFKTHCSVYNKQSVQPVGFASAYSNSACYHGSVTVGKADKNQASMFILGKIRTFLKSQVILILNVVVLV